MEIPLYGEVFALELSEVKISNFSSSAPARLAFVGACAFMLVVAAACSSDPGAQLQQFIANGDKYTQAGKTAEAIIEYRNAVQLDARSGDARVKLAAAYEAAGDARALEEYVRAADLRVDDVELQLKAGNLLMVVGRFADAQSRADVVLDKDDNNIAAHILRGNALGGLNNLDDALDEMEEAIRLDRNRGASYTQLALVEFARGKQAEAEAAFVRATELAPADVGARLALANFYWASNRLSEADKTLRAAIQADPSHQGANRAMAVFSLSTGRIAEAEPFLKRLASDSQEPGPRFALADYYIGAGRTTDAVALLEPMTATLQTSVAARERLGRAYAAAGDRVKAHAMADEALRENPKDTPSQLLKSRLLLADGRRDAALEQARAAVASDPSSVPAHFILGKLYAARGDVAGAEAEFREVLKQNPTATAAQVELSLLQLSASTPSAAVRTAEDAVRSQPNSLDARLTLVRGLLASRDFPRAGKEIDALLKARPNDAAVHVQSGVLSASRNDIATARTSFNRALELAPDSLEALAGLLALDLHAKKFGEASTRLSARLNKGPVTPELLLLAGRTYTSINELGEAERVLRQAIEKEPTLLSAYAMLGQLYVRQGRLDDALAEFDRLAQRQVKPIGALTMAGIILQGQGRLPEARVRLERAISLDSNAAVAANNLAWLYVEGGDKLDRGLSLAQSAAQAMPDSPEVLDTLGWAYYKNELPALAVPVLVRAIEKDPKNATYHYHLGLACAKTQDTAGARRAFERALEFGGNREWAPDARRELAALGAAPTR
jgi:tetratricopeptide (TPR) repeat protein